MMGWVRWALDLLFPPRCAFCGGLLDDGEAGTCGRCAAALPRIDDAHVLRAGAFGCCAVPFWYEDMVRQGIHGLKFRGRRASAAVFAAYMAQAAAEHLGGQFDLVTYVPVSPRRLRRRGYDQSRLLAEEMGKIWGVRAVPTLRKVRENAVQSGLHHPEERRANVLGAYEALDPEQVAGRRFLLVDDVLTTGATLSACRDTLLLAGAQAVVCAALATPPPRERRREPPGRQTSDS